MKFTTTILLAALATAASASIDTITIKERHFYNSRTKEAFFIKGVDYQPGGSAAVKKGSDPLSDPDQCARDIFLFQELGINTIRVYSVDPFINHDECMTMLAAAGIYLVLDVNSPLPNQHLHNLEPWTTYTEAYLEHIFQVIEVFSGYDNLLAFLAGNEVVHKEGSEETVPPYIKAVIRDMKGYMTKNIHRPIPVGYSNADDLKFRVSLADYLQCGNVGYSDFWAINSYQWCGESSFEKSGYNTLVEHYTNYSMPIFFSEYGCNEVRPRVWKEVDALFSEKMTGVFSGGLVYEYTQEEADYGIVELKGDDVTILPEFDTLAKAHKESSAGKIPSDVQKNPRPTECRDPDTYPNINANSTLPDSLGTDLINNGIKSGKWTKGKFVDVKSLKLTTTHKITDSDGNEVTDKTIKIVSQPDQKTPPAGGHGFETGGGNGDGFVEDGGNGGGSGDKKGAASSNVRITIGTAMIAAVAVVFAAL